MMNYKIPVSVLVLVHTVDLQVLLLEGEMPEKSEEFQII